MSQHGCCVSTVVSLFILFGRCYGESPLQARHADALVDAAASDVAASFLPGCIMFIMALFYLVNWPDPDIRRYSWQIISNTISIFVAVLFYQASEGCMLDLLLPILNHPFALKASFLLFWFLVLQVTTGVFTGAIWKSATGEDHHFQGNVWIIITPAGDEQPGDTILDSRIINKMDGYGMYKEGKKIGLAKLSSREDEHEEWRELNLYCFCGTCAHVTAFAAISAFGHLQDNVFNATAITSFLVVPIAAFTLHVIFDVLQRLRNRIVVVMWHEEAEAELWAEEAEEAENDVIGLACSFFTLRSVSFAVRGHVSGIDRTSAALRGWFIIFIFGFIIALCTMKFINWHVKQRWRSQDHGHEYEVHYGANWRGRLAVTFQAYLLLMVSWSLVFSANWLAGNSLGDTIFGKIAVALGVSIVVLILIFVLDKVADSDSTPDEVDFALFHIIAGIGVSLGFCWEQCFDKAVEILAGSDGQLLSHNLKKLILATLACVIVLPAYRYHIVPTVHKLLSMHKETLALLGGQNSSHGHGARELPKDSLGQSVVEMQSMNLRSTLRKSYQATQ